jgi:hypothetical protein
MNIFVYGDESGVLDKAHNEIFVFGGLIFFSKEDKDIQNRKFRHAERSIAANYDANNGKFELKASTISNKHKASLFRSTNGCIRYAFVIQQHKVNNNIFAQKKSKQRYLDWVYKVGLKRVFGRLISQGAINPADVENVHIRFDEHTTATNGRYELKEALEEEFKHGTFNFRYNKFHKPVFPDMKGGVELSFTDSKFDPLIRASDIIANFAWHCALDGRLDAAKGKMFIEIFP